jgi:hypothetical protein
MVDLIRYSLFYSTNAILLLYIIYIIIILSNIRIVRYLYDTISFSRFASKWRTYNEMPIQPSPEGLYATYEQHKN